MLSTCNRTEIYLSGDLSINEINEIRVWLNSFKKCNCFTSDEYFYVYQGKEATYHFFKVVSGLDSQIIGEPQITGQVKEAYNLSHDSHSTDALLNKLFNYGLQAQKKVRNETFLSDGAVSVSFAGVELARKIFTGLGDKKALLIGAGDTAELAAMHFLEKGVGQIYIANRTFDKAEVLAKRFNGEAFTLDQLPWVLGEVDIVISATASTEFILTREVVEPILKKRSQNPLFIIDLAIPRDIDPELDTLDTVYLYNLDDLNEIVQMNLAKRKKEIPKAEKIILQHVHEFVQWISTHASSQIINQLREYFEQLRKRELVRLRSRLPDEGMEHVEYLTESIINKIMHQHIKLLKKNINNPQLYEQYLDFLFEMYEFEKK